MEESDGDLMSIVADESQRGSELERLEGFNFNEMDGMADVVAKETAVRCSVIASLFFILLVFCYFGQEQMWGKVLLAVAFHVLHAPPHAVLLSIMLQFTPQMHAKF